MEYDKCRHVNPFESHFNSDCEQAFSENEVYPFVPVDVRLQENRERRMIIERERQKEKQLILEKRKQKQNNVQKMLKERQDARQNARMMFGSIPKTGNNKLDIQSWKRSEDIDEKIKQCRSRADGYKTLYKQKLHQNLQHRENSVRERKFQQDKQEKDKSLNYHLAQWREYEKRISDKYKGQLRNNNPARLYEGFAKKQSELKDITEKYKQNNKKINDFLQPVGLRKKTAKSGSQKRLSDEKQLNNPIYSSVQISSFGLSKSLRNPQKLLREMREFLEDHVMLEEPEADQGLLLKFQQFLDGKSKQL